MIIQQREGLVLLLFDLFDLSLVVVRLWVVPFSGLDWAITAGSQSAVMGRCPFGVGLAFEG